jgi:hypothetical protein
MCQVADMWDAGGFLRVCLVALAQLKDTQLEYDDLPSILQLLPEAVEQLPEHAASVERCIKCLCTAATAGKEVLSLLLHFFGDVHALITTPEQLLHFKKLPYPAIKAWMGSDDLVVDSEDSVAVAVQWWSEGDEGSKCNKGQLKELSGLLRMRYLVTPGKNEVPCHTR